MIAGFIIFLMGCLSAFLWLAYENEKMIRECQDKVLKKLKVKTIIFLVGVFALGGLSLPAYVKATDFSTWTSYGDYSCTSSNSASADDWIEVTMKGDGYFMPQLRDSTPDNIANNGQNVRCFKAANTCYVGKYDSGGESWLNSVSCSTVDGDILRCEVTGTTIDFLKNGVSMVSSTYSGVTSAGKICTYTVPNSYYYNDGMIKDDYAAPTSTPTPTNTPTPTATPTPTDTPTPTPTPGGHVIVDNFPTPPLIPTISPIPGYTGTLKDWRFDGVSDISGFSIYNSSLDNTANGLVVPDDAENPAGSGTFHYTNETPNWNFTIRADLSQDGAMVHINIPGIYTIGSIGNYHGKFWIGSTYTFLEPPTVLPYYGVTEIDVPKVPLNINIYKKGNVVEYYVAGMLIGTRDVDTNVRDITSFDGDLTIVTRDGFAVSPSNAAVISRFAVGDNPAGLHTTALGQTTTPDACPATPGLLGFDPGYWFCMFKDFLMTGLKQLFIPNFDDGVLAKQIQDMKLLMSTRSPLGYVFFWVNYDWEAVFTSVPDTSETAITYALYNPASPSNPIDLSFNLAPDDQRVIDILTTLKEWMGYFIAIPFVIGIVRLALSAFQTTRGMTGGKNDN